MATISCYKAALSLRLYFPEGGREGRLTSRGQQRSAAPSCFPASVSIFREEEILENDHILFWRKLKHLDPLQILDSTIKCSEIC